MKITICSTYDCPLQHRDLEVEGCSGTHYAYLQLARGLGEHGVDISVLSPAPAAQLDGVEYVQIGGAVDLVKKVKSHGFDVVILVSHTAECVFEHDLGNTLKIMWWHNTYTQGFDRFLDALANRRLDAIIGCSAFQYGINLGPIARASLRHKSNLFNRIGFIGNPLDTEYIGRFRREFRLGDGLRVAFVGNFGEHQGFHHVVRIIASLREAGEKIKLVAIGSRSSRYPGGDAYWQNEVEPHLRRLEDCSKDAIEMTGFLGRVEMYEKLASCDVLLSGLSGIENFPISAAEALCMGIPVISRTKGGQVTFVSHRVTGLVGRGSDRSISNQIAAFVRLSEEERRRMSEHARDEMSRFNYQSVTSEWVAALDEMTSGRYFQLKRWFRRFAKGLSARWRYVPDRRRWRAD